MVPWEPSLYWVSLAGTWTPPLPAEARGHLLQAVRRPDALLQAPHECQGALPDLQGPQPEQHASAQVSAWELTQAQASKCWGVGVAEELTKQQASWGRVRVLEGVGWIDGGHWLCGPHAAGPVCCSCPLCPRWGGGVPCEPDWQAEGHIHTPVGSTELLSC